MHKPKTTMPQDVFPHFYCIQHIFASYELQSGMDWPPATSFDYIFQKILMELGTIFINLQRQCYSWIYTASIIQLLEFSHCSSHLYMHTFFDIFLYVKGGKIIHESIWLSIYFWHRRFKLMEKSMMEDGLSHHVPPNSCIKF